jgi:hypothetical protein
MASYTSYSDNDKVMALLTVKLNGGNTLLTSRQTGIPRSTIRRWVVHQGINRAVAQIGQQATVSLEKAAPALILARLDELARSDPRGEAVALLDFLGVLYGVRKPRKRRSDAGLPRPWSCTAGWGPTGAYPKPGCRCPACEALRRRTEEGH